MPIYEYRCKSCGQHAEIIQKVGERPRRKCEHCGGRLEKLVSRTAFLLKGGGWYSEGYTRSGGSDKDQKDKTEKKEVAGTGSGDGKRESKSGGESKSGDGSGNGKRSASGLG